MEAFIKLGEDINRLTAQARERQRELEQNLSQKQSLEDAVHTLGQRENFLRRDIESIEQALKVSYSRAAFLISSDRHRTLSPTL